MPIPTYDQLIFPLLKVLADHSDGMKTRDAYEAIVQIVADYIRGRCVKTDITICRDGTATLQTRCRGEAATRWVARLKGKKGKKVMEVVG